MLKEVFTSYFVFTEIVPIIYNKEANTCKTVKTPPFFIPFATDFGGCFSLCRK